MHIYAANVAYVSLPDLLYSILIFKSCFEKLILAYKTLIFINNSSVNLSQISLAIYEYKLDLKVALLPNNKITSSFSFDTLLSSAYAYIIFIDVATKNEAI